MMCTYSNDNPDGCSSERIRKLHEKIDKIRSSEEIGVKYMNLWEEKLLDRQDGYEAGLEDKAIEIAKNLKKAGIAIEIIAENTGLTVEEVEKL